MEEITVEIVLVGLAVIVGFIWIMYRCLRWDND